MPLEFDRIIGKDRIEIVLRIVGELEFFLIQLFLLLLLSLHKLGPALHSLVILVEECIILKEVQYHWRLEIVWTQNALLLSKSRVVVQWTLCELLVINRIQESYALRIGSKCLLIHNLLDLSLNLLSCIDGWAS